MRSHRQELTFNIPARMDFVNITPDVEAAVQESGVREGMVLINAMHITATLPQCNTKTGRREARVHSLLGQPKR